VPKAVAPLVIAGFATGLGLATIVAVPGDAHRQAWSAAPAAGLSRADTAPATPVRGNPVQSGPVPSDAASLRQARSGPAGANPSAPDAAAPGAIAGLDTALRALAGLIATPAAAQDGQQSGTAGNDAGGEGAADAPAAEAQAESDPGNGAFGDGNPGDSDPGAGDSGNGAAGSSAAKDAASGSPAEGGSTGSAADAGPALREATREALATIGMDAMDLDRLTSGQLAGMLLALAQEARTEREVAILKIASDPDYAPGAVDAARMDGDAALRNAVAAALVRSGWSGDEAALTDAERAALFNVLADSGRLGRDRVEALLGRE
jgi:hypothetical protein